MTRAAAFESLGRVRNEQPDPADYVLLFMLVATFVCLVARAAGL